MIDKVIRDKYFDIIPADDLRYVDNRDEFIKLLKEKLIEEIIELQDSNFTDPKEYADVIEVLYALASLNSITIDTILMEKIRKLSDKGGFNTGLVLRDGNTQELSDRIESISNIMYINNKCTPKDTPNIKGITDEK